MYTFLDKLQRSYSPNQCHIHRPPCKALLSDLLQTNKYKHTHSLIIYINKHVHIRFYLFYVDEYLVLLSTCSLPIPNPECWSKRLDFSYNADTRTDNYWYRYQIHNTKFRHNLPDSELENIIIYLHGDIGQRHEIRFMIYICF